MLCLVDAVIAPQEKKKESFLVQQTVYLTPMNSLAAFLTEAHSVGSWCMDGRRRRCEEVEEDRNWLPSTFFSP